MGKLTKRNKIAAKKGEIPHTHQQRIQKLKDKHIEDLCCLHAELTNRHNLELGGGKVDEKAEKLSENKDETIRKLRIELEEEKREKSTIQRNYRNLQMVFIDISKFEAYKAHRTHILHEIGKTGCEFEVSEAIDKYMISDALTKFGLRTKAPVVLKTTMNGFVNQWNPPNQEETELARWETELKKLEKDANNENSFIAESTI